MKHKYMTYYKQYMGNDRMPKNGLCRSLPWELTCKEAFELVSPTRDEQDILAVSGYSGVYWGHYEPSPQDPTIKDMRIFVDRKLYGMTPLRQTILALCAVLNNEV